MSSDNHFELFAEKMRRAGLPQAVIDSFKFYYGQILNGETGCIYEADIEPITKGSLPQSEALSEFGPLGRELLPKMAHIVLNGGLGTSMGLLGPKSLLRFKNGLSFLEIIMRRSQQQGVKLAFMNSFNTEAQTVEYLHRQELKLHPFHFMQNKFPKVDQLTLKPVRYHKNPALEWNPPGHGDIYISLYASGLLDELLAQDINYAFISNVDNLKATVSPNILGYFASQKLPFMMEVAQKTTTDVKGGHLAKNKKTNCLVLRELAQCTELEAFFDLNKYPLFNTNNVWVDLRFLYDYIRRHGFIPLPMILNAKTVDYRDSASAKVYQVESAMGAAINILPGAAAIHVPRSRLLAVKTCNDLLAVRSDCYKMSANSEIYMVPQRLEKFDGRQPQIELDPRFFSKIDDFEARFKGMPSLLNCESLKVEGDFYFEENISFNGNVRLVNQNIKPVVIKAGSSVDGERVY